MASRSTSGASSYPHCGIDAQESSKDIDSSNANASLGKQSTAHIVSAPSDMSAFLFIPVSKNNSCMAQGTSSNSSNAGSGQSTAPSDDQEGCALHTPAEPCTCLTKLNLERQEALMAESDGGIRRHAEFRG